MKTDQFIGVSIGIGSAFEVCAQMAAKSCREMTGLSSHILGADSLISLGLKKPHHLKFELFQIFPEAKSILFFDSDTLFLRPWDVKRYFDREEFVCVGDLPDCAGVLDESKTLGISQFSYFNSGLFIASRQHHELLSSARGLVGTIKTQLQDQTYMNAARKLLDIPLVLLPKEYNKLRTERRCTLDGVVVAHFRWLDTKPPSMIAPYVEFYRRLREPRFAERLALEERLTNGLWKYIRVGHEERMLRFNPDRTVGQGAAALELFWEITLQDKDWILWISGEDFTTLWARLAFDGNWYGAWLCHERMEIHILGEGSSRG